MKLPSVGDIRIRIADGTLVEVVSVDVGARTVCVGPYSFMKGHKRLTQEALEHPERVLPLLASGLRDVVESDLAPKVTP